MDYLDYFNINMTIQYKTISIICNNLITSNFCYNSHTHKAKVDSVFKKLFLSHFYRYKS